MKKTITIILFALLICFIMFFGSIIKDNQMLKQNVIRLHVVANSDSDYDQKIKLTVKDEIVSYLQMQMEDISTIDEAKEYIKDSLPQLTILANKILKRENYDLTAKASFCRESFGKREYETFSLPSGVYESLRIEIGNAEGKNWWCVVFPSLCIPASTKDFQSTAVSAGFGKDLTETLSENGEYEIRFLFLDWIGKIENSLFFS